ncbi:hypothetical protein MJG53_007548 [Ovis ammon polii x Ovis aries]|uniref:Uncharacterized protein n=1 Tax=Ovis ammon polii x Ovis aries TaxID=2918886 RepID=A0ACB9V2X6_9CETA|nr:hypothetical protein MJG53_007548 [Ovis ammon polii x Ovis aries]
MRETAIPEIPEQSIKLGPQGKLEAPVIRRSEQLRLTIAQTHGLSGSFQDQEDTDKIHLSLSPNPDANSITSPVYKFNLKKNRKKESALVLINIERQATVTSTTGMLNKHKRDNRHSAVAEEPAVITVTSYKHSSQDAHTLRPGVLASANQGLLHPTLPRVSLGPVLERWDGKRGRDRDVTKDKEQPMITGKLDNQQVLCPQPSNDNLSPAHRRKPLFTGTPS